MHPFSKEPKREGCAYHSIQFKKSKAVLLLCRLKWLGQTMYDVLSYTNMPFRLEICIITTSFLVSWETSIQLAMMKHWWQSSSASDAHRKILHLMPFSTCLWPWPGNTLSVTWWTQSIHTPTPQHTHTHTHTHTHPCSDTAAVRSPSGVKGYILNAHPTWDRHLLAPS